jgi:hypothetical protein
MLCIQELIYFCYPEVRRVAIGREPVSLEGNVLRLSTHTARTMARAKRGRFVKE